MPAAMAVLLGILIGLVAGGSFRPLAAASRPESATATKILLAIPIKD